MSSRNPYRIYRDRIRMLKTKAYHVKGMRDPWEIAKYCHQELLETFDPKLRIQAEIALILEMVINRKEQLDFETPDFFRDLDFTFVLRKEGKSECLELQDVGLEEIPIIDRQKDNNVIAVTKARALWHAHCAVVVPLLKQHPDWKWGDACDWLEKHTGIPDIKID